MKKLFKIFLCIAIVVSYYSPLFEYLEVKAAGGYSFVIAYQDADVEVANNLSYSEALTMMNEYESTLVAVGAIKNAQGRIVNADYAIAETDYVDGVRRTGRGEGMIYMCSSPVQAASCSQNSSTYISYFASTWGGDSAFIDYNEQNNAVKVKISGATGWFSFRYMNIVPISKYTGNTWIYSNSPKVKTNTEAIELREEPSLDSEVIDTLANNSSYTYYPSKSTKESEGCRWYNVNKGEKNGYVCFKDKNLTESYKMLNDTYYYVYNNVLRMHVHKGNDFYDVDFDVGTAPYYYDSTGRHYFLKNSASNGASAENRYYSFDGNYFYEKYADMIDDYRSNTFTHAINSDSPHYPYFVYLPAHSYSGYTKEAINGFVTNATGITAFPTNPKDYVDFQTGTFKIQPASNLSMMYGIGEDIINAQKKYGVNALTIYGAAKSESGFGRSAIAFAKNNLFGMGAADDAPFLKAKTYETIADSINDYAASISVNTFGNINYWQYVGTHLGNKRSGQAVYYASDPYSGYSKASTPYYTDKSYGGLDENSSTLGITTNSGVIVKIYKEPSTSSAVIYETRNRYSQRIIENTSFIVTEKVTVMENSIPVTYYKVLSDIALDSDRNLAPGTTYTTDYSYGYIKESDLYVKNNAPTLSVSDYEVEQYAEFNPTSIATSTDLEDDIDSKKVKITYEGDFNVNKAGTYNLTYVATDSSNLSVKKEAKITVLPTAKPEIEFEDISVPQYKEFDKMTGVTVTDKEDEDILDRLVITGAFNKDVMGEYTLTYTATDLDGNITTRTRIVKVISNEIPVINATDKTIYVGDTFNYNDGLSAIDKEDGDVSNTITHIGEVNTSEPGTYTITYKAKDLDNQEATKVISVTVEEKQFINKDGRFYLHSLVYDETSNTIDIKGYLIIKGINNKKEDNITYDIIFENQTSKDIIIKSLSRLTDNVPFNIQGENKLDYSGAWFYEKLSLSDIPNGDYTVYIRARSGDYESKETLKNEYFSTNVVRKFESSTKNYQFRINYYNRKLPLELFVRDKDAVSKKNNPTIDNMYNQVYSIDITNQGSLELTASSHNVNGDYGVDQTVERTINLENINSFTTAKSINVGSITNGPYKINLKVSDGKDKTRAWYKTSIDLTTLSAGTYSIVVRTKTTDIDDQGELYDVMFMNLEKTVTVNDKKISIRRNPDKRYRIEITVE